MKDLIHKRKRIVRLFALGVVLPSLVLGYLAFRGIQNDRALLEKEKLDEHRRLAERISNSIDENILEVERAFSNALADRQGRSPQTLPFALENFQAGHPLVEQIFLFRQPTDIQFPAAKLLYVADGSRQPPPLPSQIYGASPKIKNAQQLEFQQKNYSKALSAYQQAADQATDPQVKGFLLNAVARVQKKSGLFEDAVKTYRRIAGEFSRVQVSDGIPLGLAARLELGTLSSTRKDLAGSIETFMDLYKLLVNQEWTLEKAQYELFSGRANESVNEIFSTYPSGSQIQSYREIFGRLEKEESEKRNITERVLDFQEKAASVLEAKLSGDLSRPDNPTTRLTLEIGTDSYLVSMLKQVAQNEGLPNKSWGIILKTDYLRDNILRQALENQVSAKETAWIVRGRDGGTLLTSDTPPSGTATVKSSFVSNFPDWSLEFYQPPPQLFRTFLTSRQGLYFYMLLLIAGIFIFGLILTIRSVSHELELARLKSDFVSTISHEFKSPLTSIRQLAEMLHSGRVPSEERRQQYYDVLLEQSERLSLLTENILNLAKIEEGRKEFVFEKTDIGALLQGIVTSHQDRVRHEGFVIDLEKKEGLPALAVDRAAITQALANLVDNAVKYSGESRKVIVHALLESQHLVIAVQDFGIGIQKEHLDKVFERFYRGGDALTRTVKGSGLGLTLVKEIISAHQGSVSVESELGRGSTFFIKLPLQDKIRE